MPVTSVPRSWHLPAVGILVVLFLGLAWGCGPPTTENHGRLPVLASILPLADFVRQVGGDRVTVEVLVPPGASPHTYEPTPAQLRALGRARLLVLNGAGLEFWADKLVGAAGNPHLLVVRTAEGLDLVTDEEHADHGHPDGAGNPHVWLSPLCAMHQVENIRDALAAADPENADYYRANAERYLAELRALDSEMRARIGALSRRKFVALHGAWVYLARDYGLEQAAVVEKIPGQEPSPADVAAIVRTVKAAGAGAVFAEPQLSSKAAEAIAAEAGVPVLFLNPLGVPPDYRYLDTMRHNLAQLERALR